MIDQNKLYKILNKVDKPARYIGLEKNAIVKDFDNTDVNFCFCFPDVYEVGMSHLGMQILYFLTNSYDYFNCERAFAPWVDMENLMRQENISLYSLENKRPLKEFDILGFTLQYELSYTNILNMLDLSGVEKRASRRSEKDPLIIAGGSCGYNPEPLYDIFDLFIMGEGEEVNIELLNLYRKSKKLGDSKDDFLKKACKIKGIYVPKFYDVVYKDDGTIDHRIKFFKEASEVIEKRVIKNFDKTFKLTNQIVPYIDVVFNRTMSEIFRACTAGCRFCQAGMIYRPIRERSVSNILDTIEENLMNTGYDQVGLSSLSTCDYSHIVELVDGFIERFSDDNTSISLPSLRLDSKGFSILEKIEKLRKTSLTFAPEAGSQRLRDVINKNISEEDLEYALTKAFDTGYSSVKLYFMIGLPTETYDDIRGIKNISVKVKNLFFDNPNKNGNLKINTSVSCFVPKPFTPFQWEGQDSISEFEDKQSFLLSIFNDKKINFSYHDSRTSRIEALFARGDRRLCDVLIKAHEMGAKLDGWNKFFKYSIWEKACEEFGIDMDFYTLRKREYDEVLPWDFVDIGVNKKFLIREMEMAKLGKTTRDCRKGCHGCGVNERICKGVYCP